MLRLRGKACFINILGGLILAFGIYNIHSVSGVTEGGVLGAMLLLEHWLHISPAVSGLVLNGLCYFLGWKALGRDFICYSAISAGSFSLFYAFFERFPRIYPQIAEHPLIAALAGALFIGIGAGIAVRSGGAPSGDDALAMSLSQKLKLDIRYIYLASDLTVLAFSLSYIPLKTIVYSLITVILSGYIIGIIVKLGKKDAERDVLVGFLRNAEQLDICLRHGFYHMPASRTRLRPSDIKYIAIYQSRSLFGEDAGIRYYGEVESCRLIRRNKIEEIPSENTSMYYRFEIREWKELSSPISSVKGFVPHPMTSFHLLLNAMDTYALSLRSEDEFLIWSALCEGAGGNERRIALGNLEIIAKPDEIRLLKNGRSIFFCSTEDFRTNPRMLFNYIRRETNIKR